MTNRAINNSDLWAAVRGLRMYGQTTQELIALANEHKGKPMFASQVIATAALQVAGTRGDYKKATRAYLASVEAKPSTDIIA